MQFFFKEIIKNNSFFDEVVFKLVLLVLRPGYTLEYYTHAYIKC